MCLCPWGYMKNQNKGNPIAGNVFMPLGLYENKITIKKSLP
jgi:hypothetical protein